MKVIQHNMEGRVSNHEFSDESDSTQWSIQLTTEAGSGHWTLRQETRGTKPWIAGDYRIDRLGLQQRPKS